MQKSYKKYKFFRIFNHMSNLAKILIFYPERTLF